MTEHHRVHDALHHITEALDAFDHEIDALKKDVHDGVHDALFDPYVMADAQTIFFDGPPNLRNMTPVPDGTEVPEENAECSPSS